MRKYIDLVEKKMSEKKFGEINYGAVPSVAMTKYRNAFRRHDAIRFGEYLSDVSEGKEKINSGTSYPYELIRPYLYGSCRYDDALEEQWKNLPNYVKGNHNVIVMSDVSGSMHDDKGRPMATSISLGIYFAERNTGAYKNLMMTFTDVPTLFELNPKSTVYDRLLKVKSHVGYNTDLDLAFRKIYEIAYKSGEAPEALVVISDGEIDSYVSRLRYRDTSIEDIVEKWQAQYESIGLKAPKLIMWNVMSRGSRFIGKSENDGIAYVSGSSASTFRELATLINNDAIGAMTEILSRPAFQWK